VRRRDPARRSNVLGQQAGAASDGRAAADVLPAPEHEGLADRVGVHVADRPDADRVVAGRVQLAQVAWVTASNFSRPTRLDAKTVARSSCPARRTLTAKRPLARTAGNVRDRLSKQTSSSSGSSESDVIAFVVRPAGPSGPLHVTIATPVAKLPMMSR
jgi:hypothetical protein